jgi:hypothetical protein
MNALNLRLTLRSLGLLVVKATAAPPADLIASDDDLDKLVRASEQPDPTAPTFQMAEEPEDVRGHVLAMRDFFLTLVTGYNAVGAYEAASDAQKMAVALNAFESNHNITGLSWPLEVIREEGSSAGLKTNYENDSPRYGEDL